MLQRFQKALQWRLPSSEEVQRHPSSFACIKHNMLLIFKDPHISGSKEIGFECFNMKAIIFLVNLSLGLQALPPFPPVGGLLLGRGETPFLTYESLTALPFKSCVVFCRV